MRIKVIKRIRYEEYADKWIAFTDNGVYPYSKIFKDKTIDSWLNKGHMVAHKTLENGMIEIWALID